MKVGPNFEDKNRIREWYIEGKDAEFISQALKIEQDAVQREIDRLEAAEEDAPDPEEEEEEEEDPEE